jgi:excisionase family DNA binding protein
MVEILEIHRGSGKAKVRDRHGIRLVPISVAEQLAAAATDGADDEAEQPQPVTVAARPSTVDYTGPEPLVMPSEAARILQVDPKTVARWCDSGRLAAVRTLGRHRRVLLASVQQLDTTRRAPGGPGAAAR